MRSVKTIAISIPKKLDKDIEAIVSEINLHSEDKVSKSHFIAQCIVLGIQFLMKAEPKETKGGQA